VKEIASTAKITSTGFTICLRSRQILCNIIVHPPRGEYHSSTPHTKSQTSNYVNTDAETVKYEKLLASSRFAVVSCTSAFLNIAIMQKPLKIVITNDDGYGEPGLQALLEAVRTMGEVIVAAPKEPQSFISHRVTVKEPLRVDHLDNNHHVVYGSPADCTRLALKSFAPDANWVIAGINPGANLGNDVYQSGTVAAAREAAVLGVGAMAISQYVAPGRTIDWEAARHHTARMLTVMMKKKLAPGQFWNLNLPSPLGMDTKAPWQLCPRDRHAHTYRFVEKEGRYHYEGTIHDRPRDAGSDVAVCFGGEIAVTLMEI
jgi:5'-nucleotidase